MWKSLLAWLVVLLAASPANAARIGYDDAAAEMTLISVVGEFSSGDADRFDAVATRALQRGYPTVVLFSSPGGHLATGPHIGLTIHRSGFFTMVADFDACASACAVAWLGGRERFAGPAARIGFHQGYWRDENGLHPTVEGNAVVAHYLGLLSLPESVVWAVMKAGPEDMGWLSFGIADEIGLSVLAVEDRPDWRADQLEGEMMGRHGHPLPRSTPPMAYAPETNRPDPFAAQPRSNEGHGYCADCLLAADPDTVPSIDNADRAVRAAFEREGKAGLEGLAVSSDACWSRFAELRTARSMQYCFVLDSVGLTLAQARATTLRPFTWDAFDGRIEWARGLLADAHLLPPGFLDIWRTEANIVFRQVAASR